MSYWKGRTELCPGLGHSSAGQFLLRPWWWKSVAKTGEVTKGGSWDCCQEPWLCEKVSRLTVSFRFIVSDRQGGARPTEHCHGGTLRVTAVRLRSKQSDSPASPALEFSSPAGGFAGSSSPTPASGSACLLPGADREPMQSTGAERVHLRTASWHSPLGPKATPGLGVVFPCSPSVCPRYL